MGLYLSNVAFTRATPDDQERGLVGFVRVTVGNSVRLDGLTIRRERGGGLSLSFPERRSGNCQSFRLMRPVHAHARRLFQAQLFEELRKRGVEL